MADTVLSTVTEAYVRQDSANQEEQRDPMEGFRSIFISDALSIGALKFGSFALKSGRSSPYFFNAGLLCSGPLLDTLASSYAALIATQYPRDSFDVLFGPAYKGIALAGATALCLHRDHAISVSYAYNRKEAKTHGEGGWVVGAELKGKRVLILDDVITAGTAIRQAIDGITNEGGTVVGVVVALDREEVGGGIEVVPGGKSAVKDVDDTFLGGKGAVKAVVRMRDLIAWLDKNGRQDDVVSMQAYWEKYGVKDV
ncbi:hypothetical protein M407DRAFT_240894 [Tulasnella calospora MUT 4182]|uniref:orotate phosphoribosyltransferase n=1 Tax=Tulasnella calospora MUT 4182 TaxID=1051891 RepID=A0A0C3QXD1_9AGAM|nr:hypothetical protein M407DRAFT_240894 [Tulasnella calospora MUT 4182]